jgi:hypothetical protein
MAPTPNPRYEALQMALAEVKSRIAVLEAAMDPPHRKFTGGAVWVGPAARTFAEDLTERRRRLRTTAQAILDELEAELRATPKDSS